MLSLKMYSGAVTAARGKLREEPAPRYPATRQGRQTGTARRMDPGTVPEPCAASRLEPGDCLRKTKGTPSVPPAAAFRGRKYRAGTPGVMMFSTIIGTQVRRAPAWTERVCVLPAELGDRVGAMGLYAKAMGYRRAADSERGSHPLCGGAPGKSMKATGRSGWFPLLRLPQGQLTLLRLFLRRRGI